MSKFVRTCTHEGELVNGECLDCKTLEKISKNFPPKFNKKTKISTLTYSKLTYDNFKNAIKNGEH
jgi:hypothetical protein